MDVNDFYISCRHIIITHSIYRAPLIRFGWPGPVSQGRGATKNKNKYLRPIISINKIYT